MVKAILTHDFAFIQHQTDDMIIFKAGEEVDVIGYIKGFSNKLDLIGYIILNKNKDSLTVTDFFLDFINDDKDKVLEIK